MADLIRGIVLILIFLTKSDLNYIIILLYQYLIEYLIYKNVLKFNRYQFDSIELNIFLITNIILKVFFELFRRAQRLLSYTYI